MIDNENRSELITKYRYTVYLLDLDTINVYNNPEPVYTNDLAEAKKTAIDMVANNSKFDDEYDMNGQLMGNSVIVCIDDNTFSNTDKWQAYAYGTLSYEEACDIAGQEFNGYTQITNMPENKQVNFKKYLLESKTADQSDIWVLECSHEELDDEYGYAMYHGKDVLFFSSEELAKAQAEILEEEYHKQRQFAETEIYKLTPDLIDKGW